jgi:response regulator of citrate/malate metabolism
MVTQIHQRLKAEGKAPTNIFLFSRETNLSRTTVRKYLKEGFVEHKNTGKRKRPLKKFLVLDVLPLHER